MKHPIYRKPDNEHHIVFVKSTKFLKMWQNTQFPQTPELRFGNEMDWRNDYKFRDAETGFSYGLSNPVPLAQIAYEQYIKQESVYIKPFIWFNKLIRYSQRTETACSFIDGISRTIWLFANEVQPFPVYTYSKENARLLAEYAGIYSEAYYGSLELNKELEKISEINIYNPH
ncbi:plasmid fertility inhibition factor family protein [Basilea psittacipulmonis]|uniref:plasmid fertility inhibition factor family protein n=1 Tax=Basilea psittacipulmonis TaxID=1472345 RepID=UPI00191C41DD|nr:hypothetical protein [Basilea psittacipulmonis]